MSEEQTAEVSSAGSYQNRVDAWLIACFGEAIARDRQERNHRFLEEALELVQACECTASEAHQLVDYVFRRPIGEPYQESGGVSNTHAALCLAQGIDMDAAAEAELARVWTKVEKIRAKQAAKPKHSPLPEISPAQPQDAAPALAKWVETRKNVWVFGNSLATVCHVVMATRFYAWRATFSDGRQLYGDTAEETKARAEDHLRRTLAAAPAGLPTGITVERNGKDRKGVSVIFATSDYDSEAHRYEEPLPGLVVALDVDGSILHLDIEDLSANMVPAPSTDGGTGTDALVDRFADALKARLRLSKDKPGRGTAWASPEWRAICQHELLRHIGKGDPLDVAAYAAFCWHHGWSTAADGGTIGLREALREARKWVEATTANVQALSAEAAAPGEALLAKIDAALSGCTKVGAAHHAPSDAFGAHILTGVLGYVGDREIGPGHVVLSEERYRWLLAHTDSTPAGAAGDPVGGNRAVILKEGLPEVDRASIVTMMQEGLLSGRVKDPLLVPGFQQTAERIARSFEAGLAELATRPASPAPALAETDQETLALLADLRAELGTKDTASTFRAALARAKEAVAEARTLSPAQVAPVDGGGAQTLAEACKPWEFHVGEPPDDDSPLSGVFGAGITYTEQHLAELLGVAEFERGDGSEDFRTDAGNTLLNILAAAGLYDRDECQFATLARPAAPAVDVPAERVEAVAAAMFEHDERERDPKTDGVTWAQWLKHAEKFPGRAVREIESYRSRARAVLAILASRPTETGGARGETQTTRPDELTRDEARRRALRMFADKGWRASDRLSVHSIAELMTSFGLSLLADPPQDRCAYPDCGCEHDAVCSAARPASNDTGGAV